MRLVRYSPQERVDLPDITAMSFLVLGEFRRHVRGLLIGPSASGSPTHENAVVRGFTIEPSGVPDSLVTVRLVPTTGGGRPLGFAIGGEDLATRIDFGQLIGGEDQAGNTEGNASTTFDFTGQPLDTYRLQMRFTYAEGASDNRAFWDAATNSEFISEENTRFLPSYSLGIVASPGSLGDDWITLADVVWDGASIDAGDITDLRQFVFEGSAPFQAATQAAYAAIPDFDRSVTRAADGVNEVYPVLRALARQIADIKGQNDAGSIDWFSRAYAPFSDTNSTPFATEQTKSLRTLETVTYTIGDGVTTFGDFNGADGLEDCLQHLEDLGTQMPDSVRIQLRSNDAAGFTWNINTSHTLGTGSDFKYLELSGEGSPVVPGGAAIDFNAIPAAGAAISLNGTLVLKNLRSASTPANNIFLFAADTMQVFNCLFLGRVSDGASSNAVLFIDGGGTGSRIVNTRLEGKVFIGAEAFGSNTDTTGLLMENVLIDNGCVEVEPGQSGVLEQVRHLTFRDCQFTMSETHGWGLRGVLDLGNARDVNIVDCVFSYTHDVDAIHARRQLSLTPQRIRVRGCSFFSDATGGIHAVDAGGNGTDGTGWGVYVVGDTSAAARHITVTDCFFQMADQIDAGGIFCEFVKGAHVTSCLWDFCAHRDAASTRFRCIQFQNLIADPTMDCNIIGNTITRWVEIAGRYERTTGVFFDEVEGCSIIGNTFDGRGDLEGLITGRNAVATVGAVQLDQSCEDIRIVGNLFHGWEDGGSTNNTIQCRLGSYNDITVCDNVFHNCGGRPADMGFSSVRIIVSNNTFFSCEEGIDLDGADDSVANGNTIDTAGSPSIAIDWGATPLNSICQGNTTDGDIRRTGGTVRGYNHAAGTSDDFNIVVAYV